MTRKLTIYLTLSFCGLLFVFSFLMYLELVINLEREQNSFIEDDIAGFRNLLAVYHEDPRFLRDEIMLEGAGTKNPKFFVRVQDWHGNLLVESLRMGESIPAASFPLPPETPASPVANIRWKDRRDKPYLLKTVWIDDGSREKRRYRVQIALDISSQEAILANYRQMLAIELIIGVVVSAIICILVTRRGMRPLDEITETTQRISASRLHERIAAAQWPKELMPLAIAFDEMLDRLENSFTRLSRFSADLAHELRTPINGLMVTAEVILSKGRTAEEYRQVLESGLEEYSRLSRMIERLLFLARATNREIDIERSPLDLQRELTKIHELYRAMAEDQDVEIVCQGEGTVHAEPELFGRAVSNLLTNALRHTPPGGRITLASTRVSAHFVEVRVSDTGEGIPAEHLPKIFDRFYRVDSARSKATGGMGLGLAIVKSIMELHNGTVSVESCPNLGTTFTLRFPVD